MNPLKRKDRVTLDADGVLKLKRTAQVSGRSLSQDIHPVQREDLNPRETT